MMKKKQQHLKEPLLNRDMVYNLSLLRRVVTVLSLKLEFMSILQTFESQMFNFNKVLLLQYNQHNKSITCKRNK